MFLCKRKETKSWSWIHPEFHIAAGGTYAFWRVTNGRVCIYRGHHQVTCFHTAKSAVGKGQLAWQGVCVWGYAFFRKPPNGALRPSATFSDLCVFFADVLEFRVAKVLQKYRNKVSTLYPWVLAITEHWKIYNFLSKWCSVVDQAPSKTLRKWRLNMWGNATNLPGLLRIHPHFHEKCPNWIWGYIKLVEKNICTVDMCCRISSFP